MRTYSAKVDQPVSRKWRAIVIDTETGEILLRTELPKQNGRYYIQNLRKISA